MRIVRLQAEGFKRLKAVDITPEGDLVEVRGNNAEGKSSLLDAIKAAIGGAEEAPLKPVRTGEAYAIIRADLGDIKVTRYFDEDGTTSLKVENAEGFKADKPQQMLDSLVGRIAFDPLAFARMQPAEQAAELRRLVPLKVDLDKLAAADKADRLARRDVNRDAKALKARLDVIPIETDLPETKPDLDALTSTLASAADTNAAIDREERSREERAETIARRKADATGKREEAVELRRRADALDAEAVTLDAGTAEREAELAALPPLDERVDTTAARAAIDDARAVLNRFVRKETRDELAAEFEALRVKSEGFTTAIEKRAEERASALAEAVMPVPGLSFGKVREEDDDLVVTFEGEPFEQASGAQQLRVSMALAMAANPRLRVMLIKDGSLLDAKGLAIVRELATAGKYQVWMEAVGEEGSGLIMEDGSVRGAPDPERVEPPKRRKKKGEDGADAAGATETEKRVDMSTGVTAETVAEAGRQLDEALGPKPTPAADPKPAAPAKARPRAMREFTTKPAAGPLFGGDE